MRSATATLHPLYPSAIAMQLNLVPFPFLEFLRFRKNQQPSLQFIQMFQPCQHNLLTRFLNLSG